MTSHPPSKTITIYSTPSCHKCTATKSWLDRRSIAYQAVDATEDPNTADALRAIADADGVKPIMPFVQVSTGDPETDLHWFDFRPDYLTRYCEAAA